MKASVLKASAVAVTVLVASCAGVPKQSGYVVVECLALPDGEVRDCVALEVHPEGAFDANEAVDIVMKGRLVANPDRPADGTKFTTTLRFTER